MTYYECLGLRPDASRKDILLAYQHLLSTTDRKDSQALAAIETAYITLYDTHKRLNYDAQLEAEAEGLERQNKPFPSKRKYQLLLNPDAYNHYEFINYLFMLDEASEDYLRPGQHLGRWERNRIFWQLHTISGTIHAESEGLRQVRNRDAQQQARYDLLRKNETKIGLCTAVLTTGFHQKCLYDLFLGPALVPPTEDIQEIARLIGGWRRMKAYLQINPRLNSASIVFDLQKVGCLNPANFNQLVNSTEDEPRLVYISKVISKLAAENLVNQANFERVMAHGQFALSLTKGLNQLRSIDFLNQHTFEELLKYDQYAENVAFGWKTLKRRNLLNQPNSGIVIQYAENNIGKLISKSLVELERQQRFTPEDGVAFQWKSENPQVQALNERIDDMFAYGISLLCHDKDKAQTAFLLALELKKSLKNHFTKPLEEQRETEQKFKAEFKQRLHSQDEAMSEHRVYWQVIIANIAIALTGVGLLILAVNYLSNGQCFFAQTKREQLRNAIEESPWLQEEMVLA